MPSVVCIIVLRQVNVAVVATAWLVVYYYLHFVITLIEPRWYTLLWIHSSFKVKYIWSWLMDLICLLSKDKWYVLLLWRCMTYVVSVCLSSDGKWYILWLWKYMTYVVSILAVASYYCIMCILVMSICKSVRKSYNYFGVLLSQVGEKVI